MVKLVPSSHRARPCSCSSKTGPCRASSRDFLQISMTLHLWPIELVDGKIAIVSSMRIRIMPFTISTFFELFRRWYGMITWQFNLFFLQRVIKDPITLSDIKSVTHLVLSAFRSRFKLDHTNGLDLDPKSIQLHICQPLLRPVTHHYTLPC
jgi:hypothetical protein